MATEVPVEAVEPSEKAPIKISFGLKKKPDPLGVKSVADLAVASDEEEEQQPVKRRKLTHIENGTIPDVDGDKKKGPVVIPMVTEVDWRVQKLLEQDKDGSITDADRARLELLVGSNPVLAERRRREREQIEDAVDRSQTETEDADYSQVPIESFGLAMLRGCGWKDGEGIGRKPQKVELRLPERRPQRLGLGATPENSG